MDQTSFAIRPATPDDAPHLARLVNIAGEGLPYYLWTKMARTGEDPWQVGRERARREQASFSYRNAQIVEAGHRVVGTLIGYPLPDTPEPIDPAMPAMFVPLQELENIACGTWYVNVLAVFDEHRASSQTATAERDGSMRVVATDWWLSGKWSKTIGRATAGTGCS